MKRLLILTIVMVSMLLAGTVMSMGRRDHGPDIVVSVPVLPSIVVLEAEPYYFHSDYHYHYNNNCWYYSKSRNGPWAELPRDRYPKEVKYKGRDGKHYNDRDERDRNDRDHDNRGSDNKQR